MRTIKSNYNSWFQLKDYAAVNTGTATNHATTGATMANVSAHVIDLSRMLPGEDTIDILFYGEHGAGDISFEIHGLRAGAKVPVASVKNLQMMPLVLGGTISIGTGFKCGADPVTGQAITAFFADEITKTEALTTITSTVIGGASYPQVLRLDIKGYRFLSIRMYSASANTKKYGAAITGV